MPEAHLIQLHRDPRPALASANSLFATLHQVVTEEQDLARLGRANLDLFAACLDRMLTARESFPEGTVHDVYYDDLVRDPLGTVRQIRELYGLPFAPEYEERVRTFLHQNPQHKHGAHRYAARDFGLSDDEIATRLARYLAAFPRAERAHAK